MNKINFFIFILISIIYLACKTQSVTKVKIIEEKDPLVKLIEEKDSIRIINDTIKNISRKK
jgi:hypothetical protein